MVGLLVAVAQTVALGVAAYLTGSVAMRTQTVTNVADVAVGGFLLLGVLSSARAADDEHPLGYGRDRFFWSFVAAVGILVGGAGAAFAETAEALLHPARTDLYAVGYAVLAAVIGLDLIALVTGLRPLVRRARARGVPVARYLWKGTDPAVTTVVLGSAAGLLGGVIAVVGLSAREVTGRPVVDALASGLIGVVLLATSATLLHANRELLTGRGVPPEMLERMRRLISGRAGVLGVPDIFAIVVGPSSLIVNGDIIFDDALDVPQVEAAIVDAGAALRTAWPAVTYVYLNPVAGMRSRRGDVVSARLAPGHPGDVRPVRVGLSGTSGGPSPAEESLLTTTVQEAPDMTTHRPTTTPAIDHPDLVALPGSVVTSAASRTLAVLRIATGFVFLWAFLDKTFGLHYSTPTAKSWVHGGSPTKGFLSSVEVGPLQSLFHTIAGTWYSDWLFMLGMLGLGIALIAGVAVRASAVAGVVLLAGMWFAEFPFAQHTGAGAPTGSTNPLTDYHVIYALVLVVLAATYAGTTWGLGRVWARLPFVSRHRWAL